MQTLILFLVVDYIQLTSAIILIMSEREEQFPFQQFIGALQEQTDLKRELKTILKAFSDQNIYWIYSSVSTIAEIMKGKQEQPSIKCRSLQAIRVFLQTCEYPIITLAQVYLLPILCEIASFRAKKSQQLTSFYFQQTQGTEDSPQTRKNSLEYVQRAVELIAVAAKIKIYRTVEDEEIKQQSAFANALIALKQKGVEEPKSYMWTDAASVKDFRKKFLDNLRKFGEQAQPWTQFLLVNLLQEVRSNKKQLLQLRMMLPFGEGYLTSAVINLCEDQLMDLTDNIQIKRKYLSLLNELVRYGDIEAVIMIKNSEFVPSIVAHISKLPGHLGVNQGENIYPQIKATKQVKRQFYSDFLRCLQNWALSMPEDYDSEQYSLRSLYKLLKEDRKFKFPQNIHINRFQKELQQNMAKNKERNEKLIQMLQNFQDSKQTQNQSPLSKVSNILQRTTLLPPAQLQNRLQQAKKAMKEMLAEQTSQKAFKILTNFKQNWITYLQALDLQSADEAKLQSLIFAGQKCVQQIQLITPFYLSFTKAKITYRDFKQRMKEVLDLHNQISVTHSQHGKSRSINLSKDMIASKLAKSKMMKSKMAPSKMGASKLGGKQLMDKIKAKSKFGDSSHLDRSKMMDRSHMLDKSKQIEASKSKIDRSKLDVKEDKSKPNNISVDKHENPSNSKNFMKIKQQTKMETQLSKNIESPKKKTQKQAESSIDHQLTVKKQTQVLTPQPQPEQERAIRIEDYEVSQQKQIQPRNSNKLASSRERGSKILLRRSQNRSSRLEKSGQSQRSEDRKSSRSAKKIKQSSLFAGKAPKIAINSNKNSHVEDEFLSGKHQINQTIEVNGNIVKEGAPTYKRTYKNRQEKSFNNFKDGVDSISSIHNNSVLRVFNNNAQKILLDMTQNMGSQIIKPEGKRYITEEVNHIHRAEVVPPMVGDYYQEPAKFDKLHSPQVTPKKKSYEMKTQEAIQIHKNYFDQKEPRRPTFLNFQVEEEKQKDKKEKDKNKTAREESKDNKITKNLNKTEKASSTEKRPQVQAQSKPRLTEPVKIQEAKDKQIQILQLKIRQLQKQTMLMKTKLAAKDNEIRSIKSTSKYGSQRGYPQFTTLSQSHADKSEKTSLRGSSVGKKKSEMSKFEKEVESQFKQYLQRIKGSTFRKSLLKLKCLVHKTDEIQIGCMSQRNEKNMECTLYVTPHRYNLIDFSIAIIHDNCLRTKIVPEQIKLIPTKKQQKIHLAIQILKIPFCLPQIEINYKADSQYSSNYNRLTLPLGFSKFCEIKPLESDDKSNKQLHYVRSDNFKLNSKIIKLDKIIDSFPNFTILPPNKQRQQMLLTANCRYLDSTFDILLNLHEKNSFIEGFLKKGEIKPMNFLICTYKHILDGSKK